jgi:hypothetical protein
METKIQKNQSKAKRIKLLFKKYESTFKKYNEMANFKEPCLFLMRRNKKTEFYEEATRGEFKFVHSDGKEGKIVLAPEFMLTFDYGKRTFKGYICHEDHLTPLPENPIITADMFNMAQEKVLHDIRKWKDKEEAGIGLKWKHILTGIGIILAVVIGGQLIAGLFGIDIQLNPFATPPQEVGQLAEAVATGGNVEVIG